VALRSAALQDCAATQKGTLDSAADCGHDAEPNIPRSNGGTIGPDVPRDDDS
jgi:hypothetical protein